MAFAEKLNTELFNLALDDLISVHPTDDVTSQEKLHILEQKASILAQILKIKIYYEDHLDDIQEKEYSNVYDRIDKANAAYDDLLYLSVNTNNFPDFFKQYNKIIRTL